MIAIKNVNFIITIFVIVLLQSCGSSAKIPNTNITITGKIALEKLAPSPQNALVYIFRSSRNGSAIKFAVEMDGQELGVTYGKKFVYTFAKPGKHLFFGEGENISELPILLEAGKTYFIEQKPKMGFKRARNHLRRVSYKEGKKKLMKCKLSGDNATLKGF